MPYKPKHLRLHTAQQHLCPVYQSGGPRRVWLAQKAKQMKCRYAQGILSPIHQAHVHEVFHAKNTTATLYHQSGESPMYPTPHFPKCAGRI